LLDLPLLVTLYFALSRRNPATGLFLGMSIGLLQDAVSRVPIGLNGIAKTLVGYVGSTIGARLDVEHPISRFFLTFCFFHFHQIILELVRRVLLAKPEVFFSVRSLEASLLTALLAVGLFPLLDRLRTPD
jgi:rod shape-determining protein MreD